MSWRAELLRLSLRARKERSSRRNISAAKARRRLRLIESVVPWPPAGTQTTNFSVDDVSVVQIKAPRVRSDRCILYFHGGGYVVGTAPLYRDFTWRIGSAAHASVLYFDYRLAPEHPFPAAVRTRPRCTDGLPVELTRRRLPSSAFGRRWPRTRDRAQIAR
jgi:monoterpene epsilon-lactone hydrolase